MSCPEPLVGYVRHPGRMLLTRRAVLGELDQVLGKHESIGLRIDPARFLAWVAFQHRQAGRRFAGAWLLAGAAVAYRRPAYAIKAGAALLDGPVAAAVRRLVRPQPTVGHEPPFGARLAAPAGGRPVTEAVAVSVVVPTLGRVERLRGCLESLAACDPQPTEVLLVAQARASEVEQLAAAYPELPARVVECPGRGVSRGRNTGLRAARNRLVLVTDDDCTVARDWVGVAWRAASRHPGGIVTGRVLPAGDPRCIPSVKDDPHPHDFTGEVHGGALFPNNMAVDRDAMLDAGGFDERFGPGEAAEDNEFCYRWLRGGGSLRYVPELVVWHHDWRSPEALDELYRAYARGQGFFYAKHLRAGDLTMLRFIVRDLWWAARGLAAAALRRRPSWTDPRRGIPRGLPVGLWRGWHAFGPARGEA